MSLIFYSEPALLSILKNNYGVNRRKLATAEPSLLRIARENCSTPWGGQLNPAPGSANGDSGVYRRSGQFARTLELNIYGDTLEFYSPATSYRRNSGAFGYGQALIRGGAPFKGPYKILPAEFYDD